MAHNSRFPRTLLVLAVAGTMTLAGCAGGADDGEKKPAGPSASQGATDSRADEPKNAEPKNKDQTSTGDTVQIDAADIVDLPENFPESVPLHDGPLTRAIAMKMRDLGYWQLIVRTKDSREAMATVRVDLVQAGFTEEMWMESNGLVSGTFVTDDYRVAVQGVRDIDGDGLLYTVTEEK